MNLETALSLGRVSNLPTVWTNALAGFLLAGGAPSWALALLLLSVSAFYVGGMYLNDAFDAAWDRKRRTERPLARGVVALETVYFAGFALLLAGLAALLPAAPPAAFALALLLAFAILLYDRFHKDFAPAPWLMGACRGLVYLLAAAFARGEVPWLALAAAAGALLHTVGITLAARGEHRTAPEAFRGGLLFLPPLLLLLALAAERLSVLPFLLLYGAALGIALRLLRQHRQRATARGVGLLIAALALFDGALMAALDPALALLGPLLFALTLLLQRRIAGT